MGRSAEERQQLAVELAQLTYQKARKQIRKLDEEAILKIWRNSVMDHEYHTMYELPNEGLKITLVEEMTSEDKGDRTKIDYVYVEARVNELKR